MPALKPFLESLPSSINPVVCVLSGGLDSTILLHLLVLKYGESKVKALTFNYNQKQILEIEKASKTCARLGVSHKVLDVSFLGDIIAKVSSNTKASTIEVPTIKQVLGDAQPVTYVPFRNMILNAVAFSYAESNQCSYVYTGLQSIDGYNYWDTSVAFTDRMNAVSSLNRKNQVQMVAPFALLKKTDELDLAKQTKSFGMTVALEDTLTCYNPDAEGASCGVCPSCSERLAAFIKVKMVDPVKYQKPIDWTKYF